MAAIVIRDNTTRAEIAEVLADVNAEAKSISRRGRGAMERPEYAEAHGLIDALLEDWQAATPSASCASPR